jgi:hypothetical protein
MPKRNVYPLVAPGFPSFIPVAPTSKPPGRWREWGRSPQPTPIRIGLPRAAVQSMGVPVRAAQPDVPSENTDLSTSESTFYPRLISEFTKEENQ